MIIYEENGSVNWLSRRRPIPNLGKRVELFASDDSSLEHWIREKAEALNAVGYTMIVSRGKENSLPLLETKDEDGKAIEKISFHAINVFVAERVHAALHKRGEGC